MTGLAAYFQCGSRGGFAAPGNGKNDKMGRISTFSLGCAVAALAVSPVSAAELPRAAGPAVKAEYATQTVLNDGADSAEHRRRYRRHRDGIDAGDVIAGALIIGGIFAIASAASNSDRYDRDDRDYLTNDDFDRAVDRCVDRVERERRIGSVENVGRTRSGYSVTGTLYNGSGFLCEVSGSGRVLRVDYGRGGVSYQAGGDTYGDPQYSDETYARARASTYPSPDSYSPAYGNAQPAYPGGPVPGEDGYGEPYDDEPYGEDYGDAYGDDGGEDYGGEPY